MSGFLRWIAPGYGSVRSTLQMKLAEIRARVQGNGQHARTPGIVASLALGLQYFFEFVGEIGALEKPQIAEMKKRGWKALLEAADSQAEQIAVGEPAETFLGLLFAAISGGYAHVANKDGGSPSLRPEAWGWQLNTYYGGTDNPDATRYVQQGKCVGWIDDGELYINPNVSYAVVQRLAQDKGEGFATSQKTLSKRLKQKGYLGSTGGDRDRVTVRKVLNGSRETVLHIARDRVPIQMESGENRPNGTVLWDGMSEEVSQQADANGVPGRVFASGQAEMGRLGRLGRLVTTREGLDGANNNGTADRWEELP